MQIKLIKPLPEPTGFLIPRDVLYRNPSGSGRGLISLINLISLISRPLIKLIKLVKLIKLIKLIKPFPEPTGFLNPRDVLYRNPAGSRRGLISLISLLA